MEQVALGATGLTVSRLGLGCGGIGEARLSDAEAERVVLAALDAGVTLFDAARSYGLAEERLGRALGSRRRDVVLSTKGGYGASGADDWTAAAITRGIDEACARLRTDWIDVFHFHSCPLEVLRRGDLLGALDDARRAGKLRVAAYSGDNEALAWAAASGHFGCLQCSVSLFDQGALAASVPAAAARSVGVLAKRALGNAPWRFADRPPALDVATTWDRMRALAFDPGAAGWDDTALRFAAFAPGVTAALVGTTSESHLHAAAAIVARGPLADDVTAALRARWAAVGADWPATI